MRAETEICLDFDRNRRLGIGEAVLCAGKTAGQIDGIVAQALERGHPFLLTRLDAAPYAALAPATRAALDYDAMSRTAFLGTPPPPDEGRVAIVTAGSSDASPAREAERTLAFNGLRPTMIFDVGVAGLWRLLDRMDEIARHPVVIAVAGMDAALPSVLGGLVPGAVVALPTSTGYGAARGGETALMSCLCSCAPGLVTVNIDNGYGAAVAAIRMVRALGAAREG